MAAGTHDLFYTRLPVNQIPLHELLTEEHLFYPVPASWHIIITDVKKSTQAVASGKHETVNLVATGSIVVVLNISYKADIAIPFFFGGDGATFLVPDSLVHSCMTALQKHSENVKQNFGLDLRVGQVSVKSITEGGCVLKISKLKTSDLFSIPIVLGNGLTYAEKIIKSENYLAEKVVATDLELDLTGMQCRWAKIKPPVHSEEVVSLLIIARNGHNQSGAFIKVIDLINEIYGDNTARNPITVERLKLRATFQKLRRESRIRTGAGNLIWILWTRLKLLFGPLYFKTKQGKTYLHQLVQLSDTLVIDGRINTVISGTAAQRSKLVLGLEKLEDSGEILFGHFVSRESIISCYVRNMNEKHIHFIDGADGGYTMAAKVLKQKTAALLPGSA